MIYKERKISNDLVIRRYLQRREGLSENDQRQLLKDIICSNCENKEEIGKAIQRCVNEFICLFPERKLLWKKFLNGVNYQLVAGG